MIPWSELQLARDRHAALVAQAEREGLLRAHGIARPGVGDRVRGALLRWAVFAHRRLHELESASAANGRAEVWR